MCRLMSFVLLLLFFFDLLVSAQTVNVTVYEGEQSTLIHDNNLADGPYQTTAQSTTFLITASESTFLETPLVFPLNPEGAPPPIGIAEVVGWGKRSQKPVFVIRSPEDTLERIGLPVALQYTCFSEGEFTVTLFLHFSYQSDAAPTDFQRHIKKICTIEDVNLVRGSPLRGLHIWTDGQEDVVKDGESTPAYSLHITHHNPKRRLLEEKSSSPSPYTPRPNSRRPTNSDDPTPAPAPSDDPASTPDSSDTPTPAPAPDSDPEDEGPSAAPSPAPAPTHDRSDDSSNDNPEPTSSSSSSSTNKPDVFELRKFDDTTDFVTFYFSYTPSEDGERLHFATPVVETNLSVLEVDSFGALSGDRLHSLDQPTELILKFFCRKDAASTTVTVDLWSSTKSDTVVTFSFLKTCQNRPPPEGIFIKDLTVKVGSHVAVSDGLTKPEFVVSDTLEHLSSPELRDDVTITIERLKDVSLRDEIVLVPYDILVHSPDIHAINKKLPSHSQFSLQFTCTQKKKDGRVDIILPLEPKGVISFMIVHQRCHKAETKYTDTNLGLQLLVLEDEFKGLLVGSTHHFSIDFIADDADISVQLGPPELVTSALHFGTPIFSGPASGGISLDNDNNGGELSIDLPCLNPLKSISNITIVFPVVTSSITNPPPSVQFHFSHKCDVEEGPVYIEGITITSDVNSAALVADGRVKKPLRVDKDTPEIQLTIESSKHPVKVEAIVVLEHHRTAHPEVSGPAASGFDLSPGETAQLNLRFNCLFSGKAAISMIFPFASEGELVFTIFKTCEGQEHPMNHVVPGVSVSKYGSDIQERVVTDGVTEAEFTYFLPARAKRYSDVHSSKIEFKISSSGWLEQPVLEPTVVCRAHCRPSFSLAPHGDANSPSQILTIHYQWPHGAVMGSEVYAMLAVNGSVLSWTWNAFPTDDKLLDLVPPCSNSPDPHQPSFKLGTTKKGNEIYDDGKINSKFDSLSSNCCGSASGVFYLTLKTDESANSPAASANEKIFALKPPVLHEGQIKVEGDCVSTGTTLVNVSIQIVKDTHPHCIRWAYEYTCGKETADAGGATTHAPTTSPGGATHAPLHPPGTTKGAGDTEEMPDDADTGTQFFVIIFMVFVTIGGILIYCKATTKATAGQDANRHGHAHHSAYSLVSRRSIPSATDMELEEERDPGSDSE